MRKKSSTNGYNDMGGKETDTKEKWDNSFVVQYGNWRKLKFVSLVRLMSQTVVMVYPGTWGEEGKGIESLLCPVRNCAQRTERGVSPVACVIF